MKRVTFSTVLFFSSLSAGAYAQDANKAAAIAAFDDASSLAEQGNLKAACPKFAESQRLDPQLGTLLNLALCLEQNGQTASAWSSFREAAELAEKRGDERQAAAQEHATALKPKLMRMQLDVPKDLPAGATIQRNGARLDQSHWAAVAYLDPGNYVMDITAPSHKSVQVKVVLQAEGQVTSVEIPSLVATTQTGAEPAETPAEKSVLAEKWPALAAAGVGVAGGVIWAIFGTQSLSAKATGDKECTAAGCSADGVQARSDALAAGDIATVGMVLTGVGLASATVLWFTLPWGTSEAGAPAVALSDARSTPGARLGVGPTKLELQVVF